MRSEARVVTRILRAGHASNISATSRSGGQNLLEVIEEEQERSRVLELIANQLRDSTARDLLDFERIDESGGDQGGVHDRGQTNESNTCRKLVRKGGGGCDRQPRFPGASRADEAQQPDIGAEQ